MSGFTEDEQAYIDFLESIVFVEKDGTPVPVTLEDDDSYDPDNDRGEDDEFASGEDDEFEKLEIGEGDFEDRKGHLGISHPFGAPHPPGAVSSDSISEVGKEDLKVYVKELKARKRRHVLTIPSIQEFKQALKDGSKVFMTKNKKAGFVIDKNGDIQKVFNNSGVKGVGKELMIEAIARGGRTLDCFDQFLPGYYRKYGFITVGRDKFNPKYASPYWDLDEHGTPDVVYMKLSKRAIRRYTDESGKISRRKIRLALRGT